MGRIVEMNKISIVEKGALEIILDIKKLTVCYNQFSALGSFLLGQTNSLC